MTKTYPRLDLSLALALAVLLPALTLAEGGPGAEHDDTTYPQTEVEPWVVSGPVSGPDQDDTIYQSAPGLHDDLGTAIAYLGGPKETPFDDAAYPPPPSPAEQEPGRPPAAVSVASHR